MGELVIVLFSLLSGQVRYSDETFHTRTHTQLLFGVKPTTRCLERSTLRSRLQERVSVEIDDCNLVVSVNKTKI